MQKGLEGGGSQKAQRRNHFEEGYSLRTFTLEFPPLTPTFALAPHSTQQPPIFGIWQLVPQHIAKKLRTYSDTAPSVKCNDLT